MAVVVDLRAKKSLITILILVVITILVLFVHARLFLPAPRPSPSGMAPDAQAAVNAVSAFYTLDYQSVPELWIAKVCAYATPSGCSAIRSFYAPMVENLLQNHPIQTGSRVQAVRLVANDGTARLWQLQVTLDYPWSELTTPTQEVLVEVELDNGRWLMNRILFDQESGLYPSAPR
jgi:hypothetical protein